MIVADSPALGLGTAGLSRRLGVKGALAIMHAALQEGITHLDTAPMYGLGQAEALVGQFVRDRREQVTIATKVGISPPPAAAGRVLPGRLLRGPLGPRQDFAPATVRNSFERSLRRLGTDHVDLLLLHEVGPEQIDDDLLEFLTGCVREGKAIATGTATGPEATAAIRSRHEPFPAVTQVPWQPLVRTSGTSTGDRTITHSSVKLGLAVWRRLLEDPSKLRSWSDRLGVDCTRSEVMAALALALTLRDNPGGTALFASRSPSRVRADSGLARQYLADTPLLERYAEGLRAELA